MPNSSETQRNAVRPVKRRLRTPSVWAKAIAISLDEYAVDVPTVFDKLNMDLALTDDNSAHYEQDAITQLWEYAVTLTGDTNFGLKTGLHIHAHSYPAVGYSLMACENVKASFERLFRYQQMLAEGLQCAFYQEQRSYCLSFNIRPSTRPASDQAIDAAFSSFLNFLSWLTQDQVRAKRATLVREKPQDTRLFDTIFQCPVQFASESNKLYFDEADMAFTLPTANEEISRIHDKNANRILAQLNSSELSHQVQDMIISRLPGGEPKLENIAHTLNVSPSTLRRRLAAENTNFKTLLLEIRKELATAYLDEKCYSSTEISYLLGFSESSAFNRAFKRWYGTTPSKWRK